MSDFNINNFKKYNIIPNVVFDVGSHDPYDIPAMIHSLYPNTGIYCFEASSKVFYDHFTCNLPIKNVHAYNIAISDVEGELVFFEVEQSDYSGSICEPIYEKHKEYWNFTYHKEKVFSRTMDYVITKIGIEEIDLLHMDVQGAELKVMKGLTLIKPKIIFAEACEFHTYDTNTTREDFTEYIVNLGYSVISVSPCDTMFVRKDFL